MKLIEEKPYKSFEQKIEEKVLIPMGNNVYDFVSFLEGTVASIFRIPTTIRKIRNRQTRFYRINDGDETLLKSRYPNAEISGSFTGVMADSLILGNAFAYLTGEKG